MKNKVIPGVASIAAPISISPVGAHEVVTLPGTSFAPALPTQGVRHLIVQALTQSIRYTIDGTTPTALIGFQLAAGDPVVVISMGKGVLPQFFPAVGGAILQYQWAE